MLPTTLPIWSTVILVVAAIGLVDAVRFIGFSQVRREDPRLAYAGAFSLLAGLYAGAAALTYAQPDAESARLWIRARYGLIALFPYLLAATTETLVQRRRPGVRQALLGLGGALLVAQALFPDLVLSGSYRVREVAWLQQTFYDMPPGPLPVAVFTLAALTFLYVLSLLWRRRREGQPATMVGIFVNVFWVMALSDVLVIYGIVDLPYLFEFGWIFVISAVNWTLLQAFFDTLAEKEKIGQMRDRLLTNISHELRTPLGVGLGYLELLERHSDELEGPALDLIHRARNSLLEEAELIDQLIHLSRFTAESPEPQREQVELAALVERIFAQLNLLAQRKEVALKAACEPGQSAWIDPTWFALAVKNLVHNAIKFSPMGGTITVSTRLAGGETILRVSDQGEGIPLVDQQRIFERFVQGRDRGGDDADSGLGIGLALVRDVIHAHNGDIRVFSRTGRGTSFELRVPAGGGPGTTSRSPAPGGPPSAD